MAGDPSTVPSPETHAERADITYAALQRAFYDGGNGLYRKRRQWLLRPFEVLWPFANAWSATCSLAAVPGRARNGAEAVQVLATRISSLWRYAPGRARRLDESEPLGLYSTVYWPLWSPIARRLWRVGAAYHDDNEWVALVLVQHYRLYGDQNCLELARRIFAFIVAGWSDIPGWSHPGGITWANAPWSLGRNTCSNGPGAELGAELFLLTGDRDQLEWAVRIYDWAYGALRRDDGLYCDQMRPDGQLLPTIWSYNQGSMIGAGVLLYESTGDEAYLDQATRTAAASVAHYGRLEVLIEEPAIFVTVYLRNLLLLDGLRPEPAYRDLAESYAVAMWEKRRYPSSGLFLPVSSGVNGTAPLVALEAMLAGSPPRP